MQKKYIFLFFLFPWMIFAQPAEKDTGLLELDLSDLLNITIASNIANEFKEQPVSITTISKKQIELSGARTLSEVIMTYVPGFFLVEDQDDLIGGFRGMAADNNSNILFLLNGQNLNTEWFWGPPSSILNSLQLGFIEKVEVIRGPGTITLGQGALMGVINVITHQLVPDVSDKTLNNSWVNFTYGKDNFKGFEAGVGLLEKNMKSSLYFGEMSYGGQQLRNEGWVKDRDNEGYKKGKIYDIGTRLNQSEQRLFLGTLSTRKFNSQIHYSEGERDLYNFYRDRNVFSQEQFSFTNTYELPIIEKIAIKLQANYSIDNFELKSVEGPIMGGTRENRASARVTLNCNELIKSNKLSMGAEVNYYEFGRNNFQGNNFILNELDNGLLESERITQANLNNKLGFADSYTVYSIYAEDNYKISKYLLVFGAFRYDLHPLWGNNISPRFGLISNITDKLWMRASYQTGFRGAVGLHYSGGYQQDGFLRASNYNQIADTQIPLNSGDPNSDYHPNIDEVQPMRIKNHEWAVNYENKWLRLGTVIFVNRIENVIDVGVIYADSSEYKMPRIGNDLPGNWNGYWFYKNIEGTIQHVGFELSANLNYKWCDISISHSLVKLNKSSEAQKGSMFVTNQNNIKAYPENVTRINTVFDASDRFSFAANYLYYYSWYSPVDNKVKGNHLINLSAITTINDRIDLSFTLKNVLGANNLYPMNNNVNDAKLSSGTPAVESTTFWIKARYKF